MTPRRPWSDAANLDVAQHLVAVRRGKHPQLTPDEYLEYAVAIGADRDTVLRLADEIAMGQRPLYRQASTPLYLQEDGSLATQKRPPARGS